MKNLVLLIPLIAFSCKTADIAADRAAMKDVKVIAIVPFKSSYTETNVNKEIIREAEDVFSSALTRLDYKVVREDNFEPDEGGKKKLSSEAALEEAVKAARLAGADAVLFGDIVAHGEVRKDVHPRRSIFFGDYRFRERNDEIRTVITYKFQIVLTIVRVSDRSVILSLKNRYRDVERDEYLPGYISLDAYRALTLKKLADELVEAVNPLDEKIPNK